MHTFVKQQQQQKLLGKLPLDPKAVFYDCNNTPWASYVTMVTIFKYNTDQILNINFLMHLQTIKCNMMFIKSISNALERDVSSCFAETVNNILVNKFSHPVC